MTRSDDDRVERLIERFARPARQRPANIDVMRATLLRRSVGLQGRDIQAEVWTREADTRTEALTKKYGRPSRRPSE